MSNQPDKLEHIDSVKNDIGLGFAELEEIIVSNKVHKLTA